MVLLGSSSDPTGADSPAAWAWERSESSPMVPSHAHVSGALALRIQSRLRCSSVPHTLEQGCPHAKGK